MITADQLVAHAIGDYILQSDWMANEKTKRSFAALMHAWFYSLPFMYLRPSLAAFAVILVTHFIIDRWRLARYVVWAKNWLAPWSECDGGRIAANEACDRKLTQHPWHRVRPTPPWSACTATGYPPSRPLWMSVWLLIIADNVMHVLINGLALKYL